MLKRTNSTPLLLFGAGLLAGWIAKHLFDSPELEPHKKRALATASEIRKRLADTDQADRIKEIFGKTSDEATELYENVKDTLVAELDSLKISFDEIDKEKYLGIVADIVSSVREDNELSETQLKKLSRTLGQDWRKLSRKMGDFRETRKAIAREIED